MRRMVSRSLILAFGASFFLYSEQVLANNVIYDPLDPHNTITPVPNDDPDPSDYLIDRQTTVESTEESSMQEQKAKVILEKTPENEVTRDQASSEQLTSEQLLEEPLKQKENDDDYPIFDLQPGKLKKQPKNQVLMLDDEFFSSTNTTALPPDSGSGAAGAPNEFADIAQSAYLLSGVVLYGEANGRLATRMSDQFVG